MSVRTAKCIHGTPWFRNDCPECGRNPAEEERRGREALAKVFEERIQRMEEWRAGMQRMLAEVWAHED